MSKIETKQITLVSPNGLVEKTLTLGDDGVLTVDASLNLLNSHLLESAGKHITESGANANGRYVKYDDGTMIQYNNGIISPTVSASVEYDILVTFPAAFITTTLAAHVDVWPNASWNGVFIKGATSSTTQAQTRIVNGNAAQTFSVSFIAIGRWK